MRRKDREQGLAFAWDTFDLSPYQILSLVDLEGEAYSVALSCINMNHMIYFHCATSGYKIDAMRNHPRACLHAVTNVHSFTNSFTTSYSSALFRGVLEEVQDLHEKRVALQEIARRYTPQYLHALEEELQKSLNRTAVFRFIPDVITAKANPRES